MKKFETPIAEIEKFDIADVITVSTGNEQDPACPNELPDDE